MKQIPKKPTVSKTLAPDRYWKIKARLADFHAAPSFFQQQLQKAQAEIRQDIDATMKAAGLDPAINYTLNDADCTATPQEAKPT